MAFFDRLLGKRKAEPEAAPEPEAPPPPPRAVRELVYREVFVEYGGYRRKGVVLDYSPTGARIRFGTQERLPEDVILNARSVNLYGPAKIVWQQGSEVGITLVG
jgi:PilZ domain